MANADRKAKKNFFSQCEIKVLVWELEARKKVLFGGHSVGITITKKAAEWQHRADIMNSRGDTDEHAADDPST